MGLMEKGKERAIRKGKAALTLGEKNKAT